MQKDTRFGNIPVCVDVSTDYLSIPQLAYDVISKSIERSYPEIYHENLRFVIPRYVPILYFLSTAHRQLVFVRHDEVDPSNLRDSVRARRME